MEPKEIVRSIVSNLAGVPSDQLRPGLVLDEIKLRGSIKRARLDAELRKRFKASFAAAYTAKTFGELEAGVLGGTAPAAASDETAATPVSVPAESRSTSSEPRTQGSEISPPFACGIDLEMVENLPTVPDYWEDPFYAGSFTPTEIAYCSLQTNPRIHFAARWAAKEALKKCDNSFLSAEMSQVELVRGSQGRVSLARLSGAKRSPLLHAVSVTHTDSFAAAVVVRNPSSAGQAEAQAEASARLAAALEAQPRL